jgi:hypothetical protein
MLRQKTKRDDDFVHQLIDVSDLIEHGREQFALQNQVHRAINTDQKWTWRRQR